MPGEILEKVESYLEEMKAARETFTHEANELQKVRQSFAENIKDLTQRVTKLEQEVQSLQKQLAATQDSVKPLVTKKALGALTKLCEKVELKVRKDGYEFFCFPNVYAWDIFANGQFYSGNDFVKDSPIKWD